MIVSSIIIAGSARIYADYKQKIDNNLSRRDRLSRLISEVELRDLELIRTYQNLATSQNDEVAWRNAEAIVKGVDPYVPSRPEYEAVSMSALVGQIAANSERYSRKNIVLAEFHSLGTREIKEGPTPRVAESVLAASRLTPTLYARNKMNLIEDVSTVEQYRISELADLYCANEQFRYYECRSDFRTMLIRHNSTVDGLMKYNITPQDGTKQSRK
jgi:hypothetical protein